MKKIILTLLILLLIPLVSAEYITKGVTRANLYDVDGTGGWLGNDGVQWTRAESITSPALVADLDQDGTNEIIIMQNNTLVLYNYTTGMGLVQKDSYNIGTNLYYTGIYFYQTPAIIDIDATTGTDYKIILHNFTHMLTVQYDGTITLNQSATVGLATGTGSNINRYPVIKCAPANFVKNNNITCFTPSRNTGGKSCIIAYDIDANTVQTDCHTNSPNNDILHHNTHVADGDGDGYVEVYYSYYDAANDNYDIFECELNITGGIVQTKIFTHTTPDAITDIIVNNIEPDSGLEITWGYTDDGKNWDAYTIDASDAGIVENSYCTAVTCPEGERASTNLVVAENTEYCDYTDDVFYYVRNAQYDQLGAQDENEDVVHCISQYAGSGTQQTIVPNTVNFTKEFFIHAVNLYGANGILTSLFGVSGSTKMSTPDMTEGFSIPVDYQKSGSLDIIGSVFYTRLIYYDDNYANSNYVIEKLVTGAGNPLCEGYQYTYTLTLSDAESDAGSCYAQETYVNGTVITNFTNVSINPFSPTLLNYYYADTTGNFILTFYCKDQYHTNYNSIQTPVVVSNDTQNCYLPNEGIISIVPVIPDSCNVDNDCPEGYFCDGGSCVSVDETFILNWNTAMGDVGLRSPIMKGIVWLICMMVVAGGVAYGGISQHADGKVISIMVLISVVGMMCIGWYIDMITVVPLVMFGLLMAAVVGFKVFNGSNDVGGM